MGLSLLGIISKSNFRIFKPKLLGNCIRTNKELGCPRFMSNYLRKIPIATSKKVPINHLFYITKFKYFKCSYCNTTIK